MTEMEWIKEQKERIESSIKSAKNCLNSFRQQLDTVCGIIAKIDGQPDGALVCPVNQRERMPEMVWLKGKKEQLEKAIKMHEDFLNRDLRKLDAVCSIIVQIDGQPDGSLGGPANQSCDRGETDEKTDEWQAVQPCRRRYSLKEAEQRLGIPARDVRLGMLKNEFIPPIGYVRQVEGRNCYYVSSDMLDNYLAVKGMDL